MSFHEHQVHAHLSTRRCFSIVMGSIHPALSIRAPPTLLRVSHHTRELPLHLKSPWRQRSFAAMVAVPTKRLRRLLDHLGIP